MLLLRKSSEKEFQDIDPVDFAEEFKIPLKKLIKTPVFNLTEAKKIKKPGQSKEISVPAGRSDRASFFFKKDNITYEIRYAESANNVEKGDKYVVEYEPRSVVFKGGIQFMDPENLDLLVFTYVLPTCSDSPFRTAGMNPPHYEFVDKEKASQKEMEGFGEFSKAISTISGYTGDPLRILAKAFNITGTDVMEDVEVQSELAKIAQNSSLGGPTAFNKKAGSQVHLFKGIVLNAVDKGIFILKGNAMGEYWMWNSGDLKGQRVVQVFDNGVAKIEVLQAFISENMQEYYSILINAMKSQSASDAAERFLESQPALDLNALFDTTPKTIAKPAESEFGGSTDDIMNESTDSLQEVNPNLTQQPLVPEVTIETATPRNDSAVSEVTDDELPAFLQPKPKPVKKPK